MFKLIEKSFFSDKVVKLVIEAPMIARSRKAGHFVMIRPDKQGERIPLTISDADTNTGTITLIVQKVGVTSSKLVSLEPGDEIADLLGPLGQATHISKEGTILAAGGGVGVAPLLPIIKAYKEAGNKVVTVIAARSKDLIILEDLVREYSDNVIIMTDDGSYGTKGLVTEGIEQAIAEHNPDKAIVIGPAVMMKFASLTTKKYNLPTLASLNTIMVDGTGMCGACRVTVNNKVKFVCVDGPEFDAHQINFDEMLSRLKGFKKHEEEALEAYEAQLNKSK